MDILTRDLWIFAPFWDLPLADFRCIAFFRTSGGRLHFSD